MRDDLADFLSLMGLSAVIIAIVGLFLADPLLTVVSFTLATGLLGLASFIGEF